MALTPKEELFVAEFLVDKNGAQAYRRAGYKVKTDNVARIGAHRLRQKPEIAAAIAKGLAEQIEKAKMTADRVFLELQRIVTFDPRKLFDESGKPRAIHELDDDTVAALAGLDVLEEFEGSGKERTFVGYTKKYRLASKLDAISLAMRHFGMLKDRVEHTGADGGPIRTEDVTTIEAARRIAFLLSAGVHDIGSKH
jgi:phage terminase small subunit